MTHGTATLDWNSERGFILDLTAKHAGVALQLQSIPVPADGTRELAAGVDLDKLDVLFRADVDVDGAPGQVREASVVVSGDELRLIGQVEDAESGALRDVSVSTHLTVQGAPPVAGGPRPVPQSEDELDWDDETTFEKLFSDVAPRPAQTGSAAVESKGQRGFAALLRALAAAGDEAIPDEPSVDDGAPVPDDAPMPTLVAPDLGGVDLLGHGEARELLQFLVEEEQLLIEEGHSLDEVVPLVGPVLISFRPPDDKAEALSNVLLSSPAVEELFVDDDSLAALLARW